MAFGSGTIKKRVLEEVEKRINTAQKTYDTECIKIDNEAEEKKMQLADGLVASILGSGVEPELS